MNWSKLAIKSAYNSTCSHSDHLKINTDKLQGVNIDYGGSSLKKVNVSKIQHEMKNRIKARQVQYNKKTIWHEFGLYNTTQKNSTKI